MAAAASSIGGTTLKDIARAGVDVLDVLTHEPTATDG